MFNFGMLRKTYHVKAAEKKKPEINNDPELHSEIKMSRFTMNEDTGGESGMMMSCPTNPYPLCPEGTAAEEKPNNNEDTVTQLQRPHYGLHNRGTTSYLNSVLQVLFMTIEIHDRLDPESSNTDRELRNIFEKLKETTCGTENITQSLEIKDVNQQRDAAECLQLILRKISKQASEVFQGQLTNTTKCCKGHILTEGTKQFWTLPLSLKDAHDTYSVKERFKGIFQPQSSRGHCTECKKETKATKKCEMVKFPQILVLVLKRSGSNTESNVKVDVPRVLQKKAKENKKYNLYGMVNHNGRGHYTATIMSYEDNTWYEFDDDQVKKADGQPFAGNKSYISDNAYLLMYNEVHSETKTSRTNPFFHMKAAAKKKKPKDNEDTGGESRMMMSCPTNPYPQSPGEIAAEEEKPNDNGVTQLQRPRYGLYNQGTTCYLNSVLQVLFMTTEIHDRLDPESSDTDRELRNIFEKLKETTCGTENITESLEIKDVNQQRDAAECLQLILNKISKQASVVFQGQLTDITKCCKGHIIIEEANPFWTLPLSLKDTHETYSVEKGIERIFQTKSYSGRNMVYCVECDEKTDATSGCEMEKSPQILVLLLKRFDFDFDYNTMSDVKSDCWVEVPRALQIKNKKYKLYGMVNHMGSLRGGHYTATILSNEDKTWYEFNDAHVNKAERQPFAENTSYMSSDAYLLIYRASSEDQTDKIVTEV